MCSLDYKHNLAWIILINSIVDDQGRFELNVGSLRYKIFVGKGTNDEVIAVLSRFVQDAKLIEYYAGKKRYYQVFNWWKHQIKGSFMAKSKYPAPEGWVDAWRVNTKWVKNAKGSKVTQEASPNWENRKTMAGFVTLNNAMSVINYVTQKVEND
jgi:hypothetical protein